MAPGRPLLITALPVLFDIDEQLDLPATTEVYRWLGSLGLDGALPAGTTGEFVALTTQERLAVCAAAAEAFGPRGTWWHVGAPTTHQAAELTRRAIDAGAERLAALTPYYLPATEAAVLRHYERVVALAADAEVYAYLFPARTGTTVSPDLMRRVAESGVVGVKISGETLATVSAHVAAVDGLGLTVLSGSDGEFVETVDAGAAGVVSGVSSVLPAPFLELREALTSGDGEAVKGAQGRAERAIAATGGGNLAHLKAVLELRGAPASTMRVGLDPLTPAQRSALSDSVADLL